MNKLKKIRISIERLVKVWKSKLENGEEELIADDLRWFVEIFDNFFTEKNINDYININGRYIDVNLFDNFDIDSYFKQISFSNQESIVVRPKYYEVSRDEVNRGINSSINKEINYNVFEVYLNILKRIAGFANNGNLRITQIRLSTVLRKVFFKVMTFESSGFKSTALLKDFLNESVYYALNEDELESAFPSKDFVNLIYFKIVLDVYSDRFIDEEKSVIIRFFLLDSWEKLRRSKRNEYLTEFIKSLSQKTISDIRIKEIDLFTLSRMIPGGGLDHSFILLLRGLEEGGKKIVTKEDFNHFFEKYNECLNYLLPEGIEEDDREYFVKTELDLAKELFKFRELQSLILEILGLVFHYEGKERLVEVFRLLRKNEEFSNQKSFFPKTEFEIFAWILLTRNLKFNISSRFQGSFSYRYLDFMLSFIIVNSLHRDFDVDRFKSVFSSYGLIEDSGAMNSLKEYMNSLLERIPDNLLISDQEKERVKTIWEKIVKCFDSSLVDAEKQIPIPGLVLDRFKDAVVKEYKEKSLIFRIRELLSEHPITPHSKKDFRISVGRNEFVLRKYFIPNWFVPLYGLSENVGSDLVEQESFQLENKLFHELGVSISKSLKRNEVSTELRKLSEPSFILFKNSFPDFWIGGKNRGNEESLNDLPHSILRYNTYDRDAELIIIPKNAINVVGSISPNLDNLEVIEDRIQWRFLDLSGDVSERAQIESRPPDFIKENPNMDEELKKYMWLRVFVSNSISIDPDRILRFKLDPYEE